MGAPAAWILVAAGVALLLVAIHDVTQRKHAILRNFPVIGHLRYWLERIGPELRQYIVTSNNEELPFNRDERTWVYASAKGESNYFGFGTDNDLEGSPSYLIIKQAAFPLVDEVPVESHQKGGSHLPCAKVLGSSRNRPGAFRPASVVNLSAMSFGSLSGAAVEAMNRGCRQAGCLHNTGEGGISPHHRQGAELIWQIGTGYFGCREPDGRFSLPRFRDQVAAHPVRAIEVKLSQGAKPGLGGVLPGAKVTPEISRIRGIPAGKDCLSPARHPEFSDVDGLLDFVEMLAEASGLPVGIKSAVGEMNFWNELGRLMATTGRGVDFVTVDGGEGGTGAGPLVFTDHVALPFKVGMSRVYRALAESGVHEQVVLVGSGKLGFPESALLAFALGCDLIAVAREAMLAVGCIQAQRCHTGWCPTGVTSQRRWFTRGLDPRDKGDRLASYVVTLRKELRRLARACGVPHPALVTLDQIEILDDRFRSRSAREWFHYEPGWGLPTRAERDEICRLLHTQAEAADKE